MPAALVGIIPWLTAAAAGGSLAATGYELSQGGGSSSQSNQQALQAQQQQQANQEALQKQQAVTAATGQGQAQVGGALTDQGFQSFVDQLAGYPGFSSSAPTPGASADVASRTSSPGIPASPSGQPDIKSILAMLTNNGAPQNISGGNWPADRQNPEQFFQLSGPVT